MQSHRTSWKYNIGEWKQDTSAPKTAQEVQLHASVCAWHASFSWNDHHSIFQASTEKKQLPLVLQVKTTLVLTATSQTDRLTLSPWCGCSSKNAVSYTSHNATQCLHIFPCTMSVKPIYINTGFLLKMCCLQVQAAMIQKAPAEPQKTLHNCWTTLCEISKLIV